jgi:hypothetical protein
VAMDFVVRWPWVSGAMGCGSWVAGMVANKMGCGGFGFADVGMVVVGFGLPMAELKKLSPLAYDYLSKIPVVTWSKSKFTTNPKSDLIVNNLSGCFNSYILDVRDKLILTVLDKIRRKLMRPDCFPELIHLELSGTKIITILESLSRFPRLWLMSSLPDRWTKLSSPIEGRL